MNCAYGEERVVLLHGLTRTTYSMKKLEKQLSAEGYRVSNVKYSSRMHDIPTLSKIVKAVIDKEATQSEKIHFVTHSLGGIIVRYIQKHHPVKNIGRVVMISPPNHGSEVVDKLGNLCFFKWVNGPAGSQLGTAPDGFISQLGKCNFELGVITGDRSINLILSQFIEGKDDGKVSVKSAQLEGMRDFRVIHATHPYIMKNKKAIDLTISFLREGRFAAELN